MNDDWSQALRWIFYSKWTWRIMWIFAILYASICLWLDHS